MSCEGLLLSSLIKQFLGEEFQHVSKYVMTRSIFGYTTCCRACEGREGCHLPDREDQ